MTELEFFVEYELRPNMAIPGLGVEVWKRNSGIFGGIRMVSIDEFGVEVPSGDVGRKHIGTRKSFAGALKLMISWL